MSDSTTLVYDIMQYTENKNIPGLMMLIDFERPLTLSLGNSNTKHLNFMDSVKTLYSG